jgi:hypothetical protein
MERRSIKSTAIRAIQYTPLAAEFRGRLPGDGFLLITFRHGGKRAFLCRSFVPGLLMAAKSKGKAFNKLVKGRCPSVPLT